MTLAEFFAVFPMGAGETWLAQFFGVSQEDIAVACEAIDARRVELTLRDPRPVAGGPTRFPIGTERRAPR